MVCIRCKMVVKAELTKLGLRYITVELGEADIQETISAVQTKQLKALLLKSGLELMDDKKSVLIQKIKNVIVELVHYTEEPLTVNFSEFLSEKLQHDYTYLANLFSEVQGITIEKFIIAHKIERVKELLVYNEFNLTEIAYLMHYSSVAHLSTQFKNASMGQHINFFIERTGDNKTEFKVDDITIIVGRFLYNDGKHFLANPQTATAHFICCGEQYNVNNTESVSTVEDWYWRELLPKFQMLSLLKTRKLV